MVYPTAPPPRKENEQKGFPRQNADQLTHFERNLRDKGFFLVAGVDESGRGALAGPLVAAAVILPSDFLLPGLKECKQVTPGKREELFEAISSETITQATSIVEPGEIDKVGLQRANLLALKEAASKLNPFPHYVLLDGFAIPDFDRPSLAITKGDTLSISIAAASIISKVTRDRIMVSYHEKYPDYGFAEHKGYGTEKHMKALKAQGPCLIHRRCFTPVKRALDLTFSSEVS